jgi:hypothetical protein
MSATTVSKSCTAAGDTSATLGVRAGEKFSYSVSGTFSGSVVVEQQDNPHKPEWRTLVTVSTVVSGYLVADGKRGTLCRIRVRCTARASGTIVTAIATIAAPVNVVVGAGTVTTAGGDATETIPVSGALSGDTVVCFVQKNGAVAKTVDAAVASEEVVTVTMSGDPSTDHVLGYLVLRAA